MFSKSIVLGLLAAACVTAAAGGGYLAVRHNEDPQPQGAAPAETSPRAVAESEAVVTPSTPVEVEAPAAPAARKATGEKQAAPRRTTPTRTAVRNAPSTRDRASEPAPSVDRTTRTSESAPSAGSSTDRTTPSPVPAPIVPSAPPLPEPATTDPSPSPATPQFVEVVIPASSVVGLKVETSLSSETARVEDRVEARVTRDVHSEGRVAIPAGTRVLGDVMLVDRGGKMKDKARLGVRFHTLVLADGHQVPFRTDAIFRDGSSPGAESTRKIGGAAIGGAILGAIMGGAKGAAIGGATGAAGGGAVVMAGDRNAATLPAGTIVTVRLNAPVAIDIEQEL